MKKGIKLIFVISTSLLLTFSIFANTYSNNQRVLRLKESEDLKYEFILEGKTLPSNLFPYTKEEYNLYSDIINKETDNFELTQPVNMGIGLSTAGDFFIHANKKLKTTNIPFDKQLPWGSVTLNFYACSFMYSEFIYNLKQAELDLKNIGSFDNNIFRSNLSFLPPNKLSLISFDSIPSAYANFGGKNWNLFIGRGQINQGNGFTGNLLLSDNLGYHDMLKVSTFWKNFKYSFLISFFTHPQNYNTTSHYELINGLMFYMQHRFEFSLLDNRLQFALTEGLMYQSPTNHIDLIVLNPMILYHSYYTSGNSNSIISVEANYTPIPGLNLYTQISLDDLNVEGMKKGSGNRNPNGLAGLLGLTYVQKINEGLFIFSTEGVWVTPWMYLRDMPDKVAAAKASWHNPQLPFIIAQRNYAAAPVDKLQYNFKYLGYKYGNDSAVFAVRSNYKVKDYWMVEGIATYIAHGTHDAFTLWTKDPSGSDYLLTSNHQTENINDTNAKTTRNAISHTINIQINGMYTPIKDVDIFGGLEWEGIVNHKNIKANKFIQDIKLHLGVSYKIRWDNLF